MKNYTTYARRFFLVSIGLALLVPSLASASITLSDQGFGTALADTGGNFGRDSYNTTDVWATWALGHLWDHSATGGNPGGQAVAATAGGQTRFLVQLVTDNKATTGSQTLSFDVNSVDDAGTDNSILQVVVWGFDNPTVDDWQIRPEQVPGNGGQIFDYQEILTIADGTSAFNTSGWVNQQVSFDLGTGYDLVGISFFMDDVSVTADSLGIDNVSVVPEPSSFALILALGSLMLVARRRRG